MECAACQTFFSDNHTLRQHQKKQCPAARRDRASTRIPSIHRPQQHLTSTLGGLSIDDFPQAVSHTGVSGCQAPPISTASASNSGGLSIDHVPQAISYTGVPHSQVKPVFGMALRMRFKKNPTARQVITATRSELSAEIVSAILEAALRLLPPDTTPEGVKARQAKDAEKARKAQEAEASFLTRLEALGQGFTREAEQRAQLAEAQGTLAADAGRSTPDALFHEPGSLCGEICHWVEYKNTFGFRASPFVTGKNKKQYERYRRTFGPGAVVYRLGYEANLVKVEGVHCYREADVLEWIDANAT